MENIKKIQIILAMAFLMLLVNTHSSHAQANGMTAAYTGTWQYDNGNERFIVKIWKEADLYLGYYKKVQLINGSVGNTIYNSRVVDNGGNIFPLSSIYTRYTNEYGITGLVDDNTISGRSYKPRTGNLQMKMNQMVQGCQTCVVKATWKVTSMGGLMIGDPPPFSVPLDIELTKVSNTVTLD